MQMLCRLQITAKDILLSLETDDAQQIDTNTYSAIYLLPFGLRHGQAEGTSRSRQ